MRNFDIDIYRDGGSLEFHIERDGHTRLIWLETPFRGEPRALRIDSVTVGRGDAAVGQILAHIEEWWTALSPEVQQRIREVMAHKGPLYSPDAEAMHAQELSTVLLVRNYVTLNHTYYHFLTSKASPATDLTFCQPSPPLALRNILTAVLLLNVHVFAGEWVATKWGLSHDKKFAVAVFPQMTEFIDEADDIVLLIDQTTGRSIGPLEEVSSSGGTWGSTTTNVNCVWSPDSTILIVNYRTGRLLHSSQAYRIRNRRAIPLSLPDAKTHPKGKLLVGLQSTANPGSEITLTKDGSIQMRGWGYAPDFTIDYSKHGLSGFEGELLFDYRFDRQGRLRLHDITVPAGP